MKVIYVSAHIMERKNSLLEAKEMVDKFMSKLNM